MEEVMVKLQELTEAIFNSPEYKGYLEAKEKIEGNAELQRKLTQFKAQQFKLQSNEFNGKRIEDHEYKSLQAYYAELLLQKDIAKYLQCELKLTEMLSLCYTRIGQKVPIDLSFLGIS